MLCTLKLSILSFLARIQLKFVNSEITIKIFQNFTKNNERINGVSYIVYEISRKNFENS